MMRAVGMQLAGSVFCSAVSFVLVLFLARTLGVAAFGTYAAILGLAVVALPLIECGWPARLYRDRVDAARDAAPARERIDLALGHALAATGALAAAALLALLAGVPEALAAAVAFACMGAVAVSNFVSARLRGAGRFGHEAAWQSLGRVASALAIVGVLLAFGARIAPVFAAWAIALLLVAAVFARSWLAMPRWRGLRAMYPALLPLLAVEIASAMLFKGDVALFAALDADARMLSLYAACARLVEMALLLTAPLANVAFRRLRLVDGNAAAFRRELLRVLLPAMLAGIVAMLASIRWGTPLMARLFGADYAPAGQLLPWVAGALPFALPNLLLVQALIARGREPWLWRALGAAVALGAVAMFVLAPRYGAVGAASALALAHAAMFCAAWFATRRA